MTENKTKKKLNRNLRFWIQAAVIAAVYAALTMALSPFSYGLMQVRVSEALTVLPFFTPAAIPGLFIGCLISNTLTGNIVDIIFGSFATLLAAYTSWLLRKYPMLVPLPPVLFNAVIVGAVLYYAYGVGAPLWSCMIWVGAGQLLACYVLGYPLLKYFRKRQNIFYLD